MAKIKIKNNIDFSAFKEFVESKKNINTKTEKGLSNEDFVKIKEDTFEKISNHGSKIKEINGKSIINTEIYYERDLTLEQVNKNEDLRDEIGKFLEDLIKDKSVLNLYKTSDGILKNIITVDTIVHSSKVQGTSEGWEDYYPISIKLLSEEEASIKNYTVNTKGFNKRDLDKLKNLFITFSEIKKDVKDFDLKSQIESFSKGQEYLKREYEKLKSNREQVRLYEYDLFLESVIESINDEIKKLKENGYKNLPKKNDFLKDVIAYYNIKMSNYQQNATDYKQEVKERGESKLYPYTVEEDFIEEDDMIVFKKQIKHNGNVVSKKHSDTEVLLHKIQARSDRAKDKIENLKNTESPVYKKAKEENKIIINNILQSLNSVSALVKEKTRTEGLAKLSSKMPEIEQNVNARVNAFFNKLSSSTGESSKKWLNTSRIPKMAMPKKIDLTKVNYNAKAKAILDQILIRPSSHPSSNATAPYPEDSEKRKDKELFSPKKNMYSFVCQISFTSIQKKNISQTDIFRKILEDVDILEFKTPKKLAKNMEGIITAEDGAGINLKYAEDFKRYYGCFAAATFFQILVSLTPVDEPYSYRTKVYNKSKKTSKFNKHGLPKTPKEYEDDMVKARTTVSNRIINHKPDKSFVRGDWCLTFRGCVFKAFYTEPDDFEGGSKPLPGGLSYTFSQEYFEKVNDIASIQHIAKIIFDKTSALEKHQISKGNTFELADNFHCDNINPRFEMLEYGGWHILNKDGSISNPTTAAKTGSKYGLKHGIKNGYTYQAPHGFYRKAKALWNNIRSSGRWKNYITKFLKTLYGKIIDISEENTALKSYEGIMKVL